MDATAPGSATSASGPASAVDATRFAHASEAEMARILDFYQVRWDYEPTTFPILWNVDGDVVESFAPDFYLPDLEVFLEMTTLKQRLVRKKNRKLRRLRELYPDIRIKLFYARDFRAMMLKYGRFGLVASLSGTSGQVVPDRPAPLDEVPDALDPQLDATLEAVIADSIAPEIAASDLATPAPTPATAAPTPATAAPERTTPAPEPATLQPDPVEAAASAVHEGPISTQTLPRATPRTRPGRRRRAALALQAGAERETRA